MNREIEELKKEKAALKQALKQEQKKTASLTGKVNELNKEKKALTNKLERRQKKCEDLKSSLDEELKKNFRLFPIP